MKIIETELPVQYEQRIAKVNAPQSIQELMYVACLKARQAVTEAIISSFEDEYKKSSKIPTQK